MTPSIRRFPPIAIRKIIPGDEEYVRNLEGIAQVASSIFPEPFSFEKINRELLSYQKSGVYVARDVRNAQLTGFDIWHQDPRDNQVYLWLHGVSFDYQKRGVGRKIMRYCLTDLELLGYNQVTLKTYNGFPSMIRLCRRMGFVRIKKDIRDSWGENNTCAYYYQKKLIPSSGEGQLKIEGMILDASDTKNNHPGNV